MFKGHHRNSSFQQQLSKNILLPKHKSVSYSKDQGKHPRKGSTYHRQESRPKPYYIMETDPVLLPQTSKDMFKSKYLPKHQDNKLKMQNCKHKGKEKSSLSRNKHSKSKSKQSKEKKEGFGKNQRSNLKKRKGGKVRLDSNNGKQASTNEFSNDRFSKIYKVSHERSSRKQQKKGSKPKGSSWEQILELYGEYLTVEEIAEIREIKVIYFLGKIKQRKSKQLFRINKNKSQSERKAENSQIYQNQTIYVKQLFSERRQDVVAESLPPEELPGAEGDFYCYEIGDHVAYRYEIVESINKGAFGEVVKVYDHKHKEWLALKMVRKASELVPQTLVQISILTQIAQKDKEGLSGIVKIKDFTIFRKHICIIFELLENNLYELIVANNFNGFPEEQVRIFAIQLLNSLDFMKRQKIIHCDLKPENIVLTKWGKSGVKIIDFGTSCLEGKQLYQYLQSRFYRAPEIILGSQYSYPIDMWSLGCLLAELRLGQPLFAASSDIEHLMYISGLNGLPKKEDGVISSQFLNTPEMKELIQNNYLEKYHALENKEAARRNPLFKQFKGINRSMVPLKDRLQAIDSLSSSFYNFLGKMLVWEPEKRCTPHQALQDPWIVSGLPKNIKKIYLKISNTQRQLSKSKSKSKEKKKRKGSLSPYSKLSKSRQYNTSKSRSKREDFFKKYLHPPPFKHSPSERYTKKGSSPGRNEYVRTKLKGILN